MIPELHAKDTKKVNSTPVCYLDDIQMCEVTEERNGIYELYAEYPATGINAELLEREMLIKTQVNNLGSDNQYFRIYRLYKALNGTIQIYAQHISYDLADIVIKPKDFKNVQPINVLTELLKGTGFSASSDFGNSKNYKTTEPKSIRAILGGSEGSILTKWHGVYYFNNFNITFNNSRGQNKSRNDVYTIEYGKNLLDITLDGDNSGIYTKVMPFAYDENDKLVFLNEEEYSDGLMDVPVPIEGSELVREKILALDVSSLFEDGEEINADTIETKANTYLNENVIGVVVPSITVSVDPYTDFFNEYNLCDTVRVVYQPYGIDCTAQITRTVYDSILERYKEYTVGNIQQSFADSVVSIVDKATQKNKNTVEKVNAITEELKESVKEATDKITGVTGENGGYVHLIQNTDGTTKELCITDTPDIKTAKKVWRWNNAGLGFSNEGYDGNYGDNVALTNKGYINASRILTGQLTADVIKAGTITSTDGTSYWNIETGKIKIKGDIVADSLTLGTGVEVPYASVSGVPSFITGANVDKKLENYLEKNDSSLIFVAEDGKVTSSVPVSNLGTIEEGTTGIVISNTGLLKAANAVIYGTIYASNGKIGGWDIGSNEITNTAANGYKVGIANFNNTEEASRVFYCLETLTNKNIFRVNRNGHVEAADIKITGGELNINNNFKVTTSGICAASGMTAISMYVRDNFYVHDNLYLNCADPTTSTGNYHIALQWHTPTSKVAIGCDSYDLNLRGTKVLMNQSLYFPLNDYIYVTNGTEYKAVFAYTDSWFRLGNADMNTLIRGSTIRLNADTEIASGKSLEMFPGTSSSSIVLRWYNSSVCFGIDSKPLRLYGSNVYLGGSTAAVTSDERLKYDIEALDDKRERFFSLLRPVNYKYKNGNSHRTHTGFIAQQVKEAAEESAIPMEELAAYVEMEAEEDAEFDTEAALRYDEFISLNTHMIQKLMARVDELEKEIKKLKG